MEIWLKNCIQLSVILDIRCIKQYWLLFVNEYFLQVSSIESILKTSNVDWLWFLCVVVE